MLHQANGKGNRVNDFKRVGEMGSGEELAILILATGLDSQRPFLYKKNVIFLIPISGHTRIWTTSGSLFY